jgi:hypothetical protein
MPHLPKVAQEVPGVAAFHKGEGKAGNGDLIQSGIEAGIAVDLVEIIGGNMVSGTFELQKVVFEEYGGNVLFDDDLFSLFNDDDINFEGFDGKLVFRGKFQCILVLFQFHHKGDHKSRMPGDAFFFGVLLIFGQGDLL